MTESLRIALVLNPFTLRRKGGDHAPSIARELLGRGHAVRAFGDVIGGIPQSRIEGGGAGEDDVAPLEGASLTAFKPDVIVAYDGLSPAALRGARAANLLNIPLVLVEEGFPDHGKMIERSLRAFGARAWGRRVRRAASQVIALDPVAEAQAHREGFDPAIVQQLNSGVDCQAFRPGLASEVLHRHRVRGHVLLHLGRIEPGRGIDVLIDAFGKTVGQQGDWSLVFAGAGSYRNEARAHSERLGISGRVHWTPVPRSAELPGLIGSATALLVPALDDDVTSLKIRRAMSCGVPTLLSDVIRLGGTIEDDVTGLVVKRGDTQDWARALGHLATDPYRRKRWGHAAREVALERFSWPRVAEAFEAVLMETVDARAETSPSEEPSERSERAATPAETSDAPASSSGDETSAA